jgi:hypothetical protein
MEDFAARLSLKEALELYLFLEALETASPGAAAGLRGGPERIFAELRAYLYERLSIEDMEEPRALLDRL